MRPIGPEREREIFQIARELLLEVGSRRFTMEAVAARARCSKPTLYRRWANKDELIIDLVASEPGSPPLHIDTGSLREDLEQLLDYALNDISIRGRLLLELANAIRDNPDLGVAFRTAGLRAGRDEMVRIADRAVARGDIPALPDLKFLEGLLPGLVVWRVNVTGGIDDIAAFRAKLLDGILLPYFLAATPEQPAVETAAPPLRPAVRGR
jgi:AcrR family transcriptional regulator